MMSCEDLVEKAVCLEAEVTVRPKIEVGSVRASRCGELKFVDCLCTRPTDSFCISQTICLKIPVTFSAMAVAEAVGIGCIPQGEDRYYPDPSDFEDDE